MTARKRTFFLWALALALIGVAYANSLDSPFHFDDSHSVRDNQFIKSFSYLGRYFTDVDVFSPLAENRSYRPFLLITYAVSHAIGGGAMWGYHLINILVHVLGAVMVGLIAQVLLRGEGYDEPWAFRGALLATAIFALHPLLSEPVNYISARSSSMAAALMFASIYAYMRGRIDGDRRLLIASSAILLLAMATKIIAMTAPTLMLAWEVCGRRRERGARRSGWLLALAGPALVALSFTVLHELVVDSTAQQARSEVGPLSYFLTEVQVWLRYVGLYVWPQDLSADLTMPWAKAAWEGPVARSLLVNIAIVLGALALFRQHPTVLFAVGWYYIALSPTNSIIPLSEPATEHRVYIAAPALVFLTVLAAVRLGRKHLVTGRQQLAAAALVVGLLLALGARTVQRNRVWQTNEALWADVLEGSPDNGRAHLNYGLAMMAKGSLAVARRSFERCAEEWPGFSFCYINQAVLALHTKRQADAEKAIATAQRLAPTNVYAAHYAGLVHLAGKRFGVAEQSFERALQISPGYPPSTVGLGVAVFEKGELQRAGALLTPFRATTHMTAAAYFALGYLAEVSNAPEQAVQDYSAALMRDPKYDRARFNLALIHHKAGRLDRAAVEYGHLAKAPRPDPKTLDNLARTYWQQGKVDAAIAVRGRLENLYPNYEGLAALDFKSGRDNTTQQP